jgi:hypothetical protein
MPRADDHGRRLVALLTCETRGLMEGRQASSLAITLGTPVSTGFNRA